MRSLLLVIASFGLTILCWGVYVPVLHLGQHDMSTVGGIARFRPFMCVGLAYFLIGVIVPIVLLQMRGEQGEWTFSGTLLSLLAGALGALGALGIILALNFGGKPIYVSPLVFGGAPVVNSFLTIYLAKRLREIGPFFLAGLIMVLIGATTVMVFAPRKAPPAAVQAAPVAAGKAQAPVPAPPQSNVVLQILSIGLVVACWGAYGPTLHKGQAAMKQSRLRPLLCVGLAYFAIAVIIPLLWLQVSPEASEFNFRGTLWSLAGGAAGAVGALGIIMAFAFGGKPVYVMPLVFGGAPVVATIVSILIDGTWQNADSMTRAAFLAGLMLVIAGAAMVLVFAPKGHAPAPAVAAPPSTFPPSAATPAGESPGTAGGEASPESAPR